MIEDGIGSPTSMGSGAVSSPAALLVLLETNSSILHFGGLRLAPDPLPLPHGVHLIEVLEEREPALCPSSSPVSRFGRIPPACLRSRGENRSQPPPLIILGPGLRRPPARRSILCSAACRPLDLTYLFVLLLFASLIPINWRKYINRWTVI
jgi:hypothetical protein